MKIKGKYKLKNIGSLILGDIKRLTNSLPTLILIILVLGISINIIRTIDSNRGLSFDKTVAIVDDDKSLEVKIFLKNITSNKLKNILNFINIDLDQAKDLLADNEISAIIHIEKDTFNQLNYGEKAKINVYYNNKTDIVVNFMINYMENLISVLNHGQTGAMIYWDIMKAEGFTYKQRLDNINGIFIDYAKSFITRNNIYIESDFNNYEDTSFVDFYFIGFLILISILFVYSYHWDIDYDIRNGLVIRQIFSGYTMQEILLSKVILGSIYITLVFQIIQYMYCKLLGDISSLSIGSFTIILCYCIIINMIIVLLYFICRNLLYRNILICTLTVAGVYTSGLIVPIRALPSLFYNLRYFNLIYNIQIMLTTSNIKPINILSIFIYMASLMALLSGLVRKRGIKC